VAFLQHITILSKLNFLKSKLAYKKKTAQSDLDKPWNKKKWRPEIG
jgi:hypothetical protein